MGVIINLGIIILIVGFITNQIYDMIRYYIQNKSSILDTFIILFISAIYIIAIIMTISSILQLLK